MSFHSYLIFGILFVALSFSKNVEALYENNPFFQGENRPDIVQTLPTNKPVTLSITQTSATTKEPLFTIEPPEVLYGNQLHKKCLKPRGQFPSDFCKNYVNCWDGVAIEQACLGNFLFNPVKLYCDSPENVDCRGKPIVPKVTYDTIAVPNNEVTTVTNINPTNTLTSNSIPPGDSHSIPALRKLCLRSTGLFPGSTCGKFVNCWDDNAVEQDCPPGLYFSSEGYCDYPANVHCNSQNDNGEISSNLQVKLTDCPMEFGSFRNGSNCGRYYTCAFHKVVGRYSCPDGLSFSDTLGICDYSYRVDCSKEPQYYDIRGINAPNTDCPLEFGNFRNSTNCSHYYTCAFYKVAARYQCPEGLSFSDLLGVCDHTYRVDCSREPQIFNKKANNMQGQEFPFNAFAHPDLSVPASKDDQCSVLNGLIRDQENCSSYYVCDSGKVVANYICPSGFKFSDKLGVCDYEEKVNCNDPGKAFEIGPGNLASSNMVIPNISNEVISQVQNCTPGSVFRLNLQCTSACRCRNGVAEIIQCPAGLAYDSKMDKCLLMHLARC